MSYLERMPGSLVESLCSDAQMADYVQEQNLRRLPDTDVEKIVHLCTNTDFNRLSRIVGHLTDPTAKDLVYVTACVYGHYDLLVMFLKHHGTHTVSGQQSAIAFMHWDVLDRIIPLVPLSVLRFSFCASALALAYFIKRYNRLPLEPPALCTWVVTYCYFGGFDEDLLNLVADLVGDILWTDYTVHPLEGFDENAVRPTMNFILSRSPPGYWKNIYANQVLRAIPNDGPLRATLEADLRAHGCQ